MINTKNIARYLQLLIWMALPTFFVSCSVQKQIANSARKIIVSDSSLLNAHVGISIYEPAINKYWYSYNAEKYFVPASNVKIPTCFAAMKYLGDSLVGARVVESDSKVAVFPSGDPTFLHSNFSKQPVYDFLKGFDTISLVVNSSPEFLGNGWAWNDYMEGYMAQRSMFPIYGNVVKFNWRNEDSITANPKTFENSFTVLEKLTTGFEIVKPWEENIFLFMNGKDKIKEIPFSPQNGTIADLLKDTLNANINIKYSTPLNAKIVYSQPTDSVLKIMMHRSDNFFAEQMLLMVSNEKLGLMDDEKIIDTILKSDFTDFPQQPRWVDGSGLSRYNLFTPNNFVAILNKMKKEFGMNRISTIFPTGNEGTLSNFYQTDSNFIFAKTGTLAGTVALSGFLITQKNKTLIFSILINNHQASSVRVRKAIERFLQQLRINY